MRARYGLLTALFVLLLAASITVAQDEKAPAPGPERPAPAQYGASTGASLDGIPLLWVRQKTPVGGHLRSIFFLDENTGWACGHRGAIISTTDGGQTWIRRDSGAAADLHKILFTTPEDGWCVGESGTLLRTTDGGVTWQSIPLWSPCNTGFIPDLYNIQFVGDQGYIVGQCWTVLYTQDNGNVWIPRQGPLRLTREKTDNVTIMELSERREPYRDYNFLGLQGNTPYSNPRITKRYVQKTQSRTDGYRWVHRHRLRESSKRERYYALDFISPEVGWIAGTPGGRIMHSTTGWLRWGAQVKRAPAATAIYDVDFLDQETGWAVGNNGVWLTRDGGERWYRPQPPCGAYYRPAAITTEQDRQHIANPGKWDRHGTWLYAGKCEVCPTVCYYDGAMHVERANRRGGWKDTDPPELHGVHFIDQDIGFAVGQRAHIMFTANGGHNWALYMAPHLNQGPDFEKSTATWRAPTFFDVQFLDNQIGWVCGEWGTILRYNGPPIEAAPREPEYAFPFHQVLRRQAHFFDSGTR